MTVRCRIARTASNAHALPAGVPAPDADTCRRLQALIRRYLSPATATVLAEPVPSEDDSQIDWFSPLGGQPIRLPDLPQPEQQRARRLLETRLHAIRELARRLPDLEPGTDAGTTLLQATAHPGDDSVFVVDGQPVITFWSYGKLPDAEPEPPNEAPVSAQRAKWPALAAVAVLLLGLSAGAVFRYGLLRWPPWGPDYAALLAAEHTEGERLRHELLDRQGELAANLGRCALRDQVETLQRERAMLAVRLDELGAALRTASAKCRQR